MSEGSDRAAASMAERASIGTTRMWFVLVADRWLVTTALSIVLWVAIVAAGVAHPTPVGELLTEGDPIGTLFQALVAATVTAVTLVLTLSQLVLSQELGAVGDQRERMDGAMAFRDDVAAAIGTDVSPAEPSAFLRSLLGATGDRARTARAALGADDEDGPVVRYLDAVIANADAATDRLEGARFGTFDVVHAALDFNYSWKLYAGRRLLADHREGLSAEAVSALEDLTDLLRLYGPAREHVKTLYFQWELSSLSRTLLLTAIPALAVSITTLLFFEPATVTGTTLGLDHALVVVATATTLSLVPFTILLAYVLRIVTVTKRTLSIGPFILRETDRDVDLDRD